VSQWAAAVIACLLLLDGSLPGEDVPLGSVGALVPLAALLGTGSEAQTGRRIAAAVKGGGLPVDPTRSRRLEQGALPSGPLDQAGGVADDAGRRGGASSSTPSPGIRARPLSHLTHPPHTAARGFVVVVRVAVVVATMSAVRAIQFPFQRRQTCQ